MLIAHLFVRKCWSGPDTPKSDHLPGIQTLAGREVKCPRFPRSFRGHHVEPGHHRRKPQLGKDTEVFKGKESVRLDYNLQESAYRGEVLCVTGKPFRMCIGANSSWSNVYGTLKYGKHSGLIEIVVVNDFNPALDIVEFSDWLTERNAGRASGVDFKLW